MKKNNSQPHCWTESDLVTTGIRTLCLAIVQRAGIEPKTSKHESASSVSYLELVRYISRYLWTQRGYLCERYLRDIKRGEVREADGIGMWSSDGLLNR